MYEEQPQVGDAAGTQGASAPDAAGRLVAVLVTHNRLSQLQQTLRRLLATPAALLQAIVVVDNASNDDTAEWLAGLGNPRLDVLRLERNSGGAGGFAAGMARARDAHDPDWLLLMDDDARPAPGALAAFRRTDLTRWDALAAAVYFPDGRICEMNRPSRNPFWHKREFLDTAHRGRDGFHLSPSAYAQDEILPIDVTSFVGFFLSARGLETAGLPDPGLFLYGDDGLYTLGLAARGGRIGFAPHVRFEHDCSTFATGQRGRFRPLWKVYYYHRNLLMLYRMAAGWLFWPALMVVVPKWLWKLRDHKGQRRPFAGLILRALRDGLLRRTATDHATVRRWSGEA